MQFSTIKLAIYSTESRELPQSAGPTTVPLKRVVTLTCSRSLLAQDTKACTNEDPGDIGFPLCRGCVTQSLDSLYAAYQSQPYVLPS